MSEKKPYRRIFSQETFRTGNLVRLPVGARDANVGVAEQFPPGEPARVLSMRRWKERILKQPTDNPEDKAIPRPTTAEEKRTKLTELEKLTTRDKLLMIINILADERLTDDLLLKTLISLESLELEESRGS